MVCHMLFSHGFTMISFKPLVTAGVGFGGRGAGKCDHPEGAQMAQWQERIVGWSQLPDQWSWIGNDWQVLQVSKFAGSNVGRLDSCPVTFEFDCMPSRPLNIFEHVLGTLPVLSPWTHGFRCRHRSPRTCMGDPGFQLLFALRTSRSTRPHN